MMTLEEWIDLRNQFPELTYLWYMRIVTFPNLVESVPIWTATNAEAIRVTATKWRLRGSFEMGPFNMSHDKAQLFGTEAGLGGCWIGGYEPPFKKDGNGQLVYP